MPLEKTVIIADSTTHYWVYHPHKTPVIIMIHGFRGTHHGLELIAKQLPDYKIIIPDLPAFGKSTPLKHHTIADYSAWLATFIKTQNCAILLGHSFGSIISAHYATTHHQIKRLILVNPIGSPALSGPRKIATLGAIFYYWLGEKLPDSTAHTWLEWRPIVYVMSRLMSKTHNRTLNHFIDQQHYAHFSDFSSPQSLLESFHASINHSVQEYAKRISTKTLLIAGEKDDITPLKKQEELQQLFPSASLVVIPKVGHLTHYETPRQVAQSVRTFVKSA